jgi:hypothetical protein
MFRSMSRLFAAAAVVLSLAILSVPTAQARPLDDRAQAVRLESSWFQAALSWLAGLLPAGGHGMTRQTSAASNSGGGGSTTITPMTGSCIDPQGGGRWCTL